MFAWLRKNDRGFTLVELMMVIVILGILAGVAIPLIGNMRDRAWAAKLAATADAIGTAVIYYNLDNDPPIRGCTAADNCSNITDLVNIPNDVLLVGALNAAIDEGKHYLIITTTTETDSAGNTIDGIDIQACKGVKDTGCTDDHLDLMVKKTYKW